MTTRFPAAFDSFVNPSGAVDLDTSALWTHAQQHSDLNDAVEALEAVVGTTAQRNGNPGAYVTRSEKNISNVTKTAILLPSVPAQLALFWTESGTSGSLKYVLESASPLDADARFLDDSAHGELFSGGVVLLQYEPLNTPNYLYVLATSAVGGGTNLVSVLAKVAV